jgi:orotidine-5'-phosphate decarboxylase
VLELAKVGLPIFLDLKLHDIPNTVAGAMQAIHVLQPSIVTIHAAGARHDGRRQGGGGRAYKVVAVTVLTSLDDGDWPTSACTAMPMIRRCVWPIWRIARGSTASSVRAMKWAPSSSSGRTAFRRPRPAPADGVLGDQKRSVTPRAARDAGASVLVIGRPISRAEDPLAAARAIEATL